MPNFNTLFTKYKYNLSLLRELGRIDNDAEFICPICLQEFTNKDIDILSMEDAPPESLGGKKICITCKNCNNKCGHDIDNYLFNYISSHERSQMLPGTSGKIAIQTHGQEIFGSIINKLNGRATIRIPMTNKGNNPIKAHNYVNTHGYMSTMQIRNVYPKHDQFKTAIAMLKTAYIILFSKYGYAFLLDKSYDIIRSQIQNPNKKIIDKIWVNIGVSSHVDNTHIFIITEKGCEGFFVQYTLKQTGAYRVMVFIPFPNAPYSNIFAKHDITAEEIAIPVTMSQDIDYLTDKKNIQDLIKVVYAV